MREKKTFSLLPSMIKNWKLFVLMEVYAINLIAYGLIRIITAIKSNWQLGIRQALSYFITSTVSGANLYSTKRLPSATSFNGDFRYSQL